MYGYLGEKQAFWTPKALKSMHDHSFLTLFHTVSYVSPHFSALTHNMHTYLGEQKAFLHFKFIEKYSPHHNFFFSFGILLAQWSIYLTHFCCIYPHYVWVPWREKGFLHTKCVESFPMHPMHLPHPHSMTLTCNLFYVLEIFTTPIFCSHCERKFHFPGPMAMRPTQTPPGSAA